MAQNMIRVNSISDRYVTETMIGLNLNLDEEIDFDFFDNIEKPCEVSFNKEDTTVSDIEPRPSSPDSEEEEDDDDDDDVQVSPQILCHDPGDYKSKQHLAMVETKPDDNSPEDCIKEPISTNTKHEKNLADNFNESILLDKPEDVDNSETIEKNGDSVLLKSEVDETVSLKLQTKEDQTVSQEATCNSESSSSLDEIPIKSPTLLKSSLECSMTESPLQSEQETVMPGDKSIDPLGKEDTVETTDQVIPNQFSPSKECGDTDSLPSQDGASSSKTSETHESGADNDILDFDEGCPFEESDSEELLLAVHTLMIIPRERDGMSQEEKLSGLSKEKHRTEVQHVFSNEKINVTARSSSGYSSASCKTHGPASTGKVVIPRANDRQHSPVKVCTPDRDEFIKPFRSFHRASPAGSSSSCHKLSLKSPSWKRQRKNMSFSNEEIQRIERENAILLNKIVLQQRPRPPVMHNYDRHVCSNAINRARQLKRIEYDNEILLRKIQDAKRRSSSCSSSRCTSQASSSQF